VKRALPAAPPGGLVAYELESGRILFVLPLSAKQLGDLTAAEQEVATLLLDGRDNAGIAKERGTSLRTTANQVASIFRKLGVSSRAELAAKVYSPDTQPRS
jgi:DNA-binding NarL/FixJ family response regulator